MSSIFLTYSSGHRDTILVFGISMLLVAIFAALLELNGFDAIAAMRDGVLSEKPAAGIISDFGILLLGTSALFSLMQGWIKKVPSTFALGAFCGLFVFDDWFLIHERLGKFEVIFFAFYGLFLCFLLMVFTRINSGYIVWPIIYTFIAFVSSVIIDIFWWRLLALEPFGLGPSDWHLGNIGYCIEDILKFGGIAVLSSFAIGQGLNTKHLASADDLAV